MDTKTSFKDLKKLGYKFILSNNKPIGVLVDVEYFEQITASLTLEEVDLSSLPDDVQEAYKKTISSPKDSFLNI